MLAVLNPGERCVTEGGLAGPPSPPARVLRGPTCPRALRRPLLLPWVLGLRQLRGGSLRSSSSPRARSLLGCRSEGARPQAGGPVPVAARPCCQCQSPEVADCRFLTEKCRLLLGHSQGPFGSRARRSGGPVGSNALFERTVPYTSLMIHFLLCFK